LKSLKTTRREFFASIGAALAFRGKPPKPKGVEGVSIRYVHSYDPIQDRIVSRMDVLSGWSVDIETGPALQSALEYQRDYNRMLSEQLELLELEPLNFPNRPLVPRYTVRISS
jgi:hypothetical protein